MLKSIISTSPPTPNSSRVNHLSYYNISQNNKEVWVMFEPLLDPGIITGHILVHVGLIVVSIVALVLYLTKRDARVNKFLKAFQSPPTLPIFGNAHSLLGPHEHLLNTMCYWVKLYGTCIAGWIGNYPYVFLADPYNMEKILSSTTHINKAKDYKYLETWLGTGLLTSNNKKWHQRRKLLTPTFHFKILEDFFPIFNEQAKILNVILERQTKISNTFDICPFISKCTLDVICETAMGEKINAQLGGEAEYVEAVCGMTEVILQKGLNPFYRNPYIFKITRLGRLETKYLKKLHEFTDKMIKDRKIDRKRKLAVSSDKGNIDELTENAVGSKRRKAFLDLLLDLQESENLTDNDVREEVDTFMFEGHDTTGTSLDWTVLMLACNPDCQKRLHEELDRVFEDDMERDVTMGDLTELKYLECCLKEALRLYPSVPFFLRSADVDIELDKERTIPKNTSILLSTYMLHRYPEVFPDPEKFDPERFSPENSLGRHPYAYIPFSAGPRNCIGQKFALIEEKIILATLMRKFCLEAVDTKETVLPIPVGVLRPKHGIKVRLVTRQ